MAKFDQFGSLAPGQGGSNRDCLRYEALLAEVVDGTLSAEDQAAFDRHRETCDSCSEMLKDAQRGAAWLAMLKPHRPEPSATLVDRILAQTSVRAAQEAEAVRVAHRAAAEAASLLGPAHLSSSRTAAAVVAPAASARPAETGKVLAFRSRVPSVLRPALNTILQTRFAMTAAMAFFSVALTLNLTGVHLSDLHARDLRPSSLRRSLYEANAHVARYYENLRVVYELESRVRDLQRSSDAEPVAAPPRPSPEPAAADPKSTDKPGNPSSSPQSKPAGKPRSGLSNGSESRDAGRPHSDSDLARHHPGFVAPQGAILPVSLSHLSPNLQKRGLA